MRCQCCAHEDSMILQCEDCGAVLCLPCMATHNMGKEEHEHRCLLCPMPPIQTEEGG